MKEFTVRARTDFYGKCFRVSLSAIVVTALISCGDNKKDDQATISDSAPAAGNEAVISGTIRLDPALQNKVGKEPLLMIMASSSPEPTKPAVVVKRVADANFPYNYKLTPEDIPSLAPHFPARCMSPPGSIPRGWSVRRTSAHSRVLMRAIPSRSVQQRSIS